MSTESNHKLTLGSKQRDPRDRFLHGLGKSQSSGTDNQVLQKSVDINAADQTADISYLEKKFNDDNDVIDDLLVQTNIAEQIEQINKNKRIEQEIARNSKQKELEEEKM